MGCAVAPHRSVRVLQLILPRRPPLTPPGFRKNSEKSRLLSKYSATIPHCAKNGVSSGVGV